MFRNIVLLLSLLATLPAFAQIIEPDDRFGRVSDAARTLTTVPGDSSATAYVLYKKLSLDFGWLDDKGPVTRETFHRRVKLMQPAAFDLADVSIRFYQGHQRVYDVDAAIHLPTGGTIKLKNRDINFEKQDDESTLVKFTFPQVVEGAIIEYKYTLHDEYITVPAKFYFQEEHPVKWAEYESDVPNYFTYVSLGRQWRFAIDVNEQTRARPYGLRQATAYNQGQGVAYTHQRKVMQDVPAFEYQPYSNNTSDFAPQVALQLRTVQFPGREVQYIFDNWNNTAKDLLSRRDFGRFIGTGGHSNQVWKEIGGQVEAAATPREKIATAYYYVAKRFNWNGEYSIVADLSPDQLLKEGTGNSADMNAMLIALLRRAGITAHPMLVSLRDRGAHHEYYPLLSQFNHLMVYAELGDQYLVLDANDPNRPPGLPRLAALNHRGWVADLERPRWVDVKVAPARRVVMTKLDLDENGMADVDLQSRMASYYAFGGVSQIKEMEEKTEAPLVKDILTVFPEAELVDVPDDVELDDKNRLAYNAKLRVAAGEKIGDLIYLRPLLIPVLEDELDDTEYRLYPIDFPFPWVEQYSSTINLPEGYEVDELPESIRMTSEDNGMSCTYTAQDNGDHTVTVNFIVKLDRTVYPAEAYPALRELYRSIIELQESIVVLRQATR